MISPDQIIFAEEQDRLDPLAFLRNQYNLPKERHGSPSIYLCGNSLGLQPLKAHEYVSQELNRWAALGVKGHFEGDLSWVDYSKSMVLATSKIVGAQADEVTIMNTLTVNIHLMLVSFYRPEGKKNKILIEHSPFPSDMYALKSHLRFKGLDPHEVLIELKPRHGEYIIRKEDIETCFYDHGDTIALVYVGSVNYLSGQAFDISDLAQNAHRHGAMIGVDLAHGAGNIILKLHDWEVDFAVWCHYKYLNGGPNSLAGCFIHRHHHGKAGMSRLEGWWGHDAQRRFLMEPDFIPMTGVQAWQLSGPPILSLAGMRAGIEDFYAVGMETLRAKSVILTQFLQDLILAIDDPRIRIISPLTSDQRGCQLSIMLSPPDKKVFEALIASGVVVDWREPGIMRVAPVPMYNSFEEVYKFVSIFKYILKKQS